MTRFPRPYFRAQRSTWCVQIDGKQITLGADRDEALREYHRLMARRDTEVPAAPVVPEHPLVAVVRDRYSDINGTVTNAYDALDRLTASTDVYGLTVTYGYDADSNQTSMQDSAGGVVTSVSNADDRLTSRELGGSGVTPLLATFAYDNANERTGETRYADLAGTTEVAATSDGYDGSGRLTTITLQNASGTTLAYYDYQYDNADRVTQQSWSSTTATGTLSGTVTYGYDAASQLTNDGSTTYSYDNNGNRTNSGYGTGTGNELTTDGTYNYSYDAVGDLVQKSTVSGTTTWTYGYDVANHLTSVVETTSGSTVLQVTYTYDVLGERVAQSEWVGGMATVTHFAYDDKGNLWAELSSVNAVQTRYLYGDGTDEVLAREDGTTAYWYQTDNEGSVRDAFASKGR